MSNDPVNNPKHYTSNASGIECIQVTEHMNFCIGNAIKYLWRAGLKGEALEDLKKARWYVEREIARLEKEAVPWPPSVGDLVRLVTPRNGIEFGHVKRISLRDAEFPYLVSLCCYPDHVDQFALDELAPVEIRDGKVQL